MNNKELVRTAVTEAFLKGDVTAIDRYWSDDYIQHNPQIPDGREALKNFLATMAANLKYEIGLIIADGDFVMIHGKYTGFGPEPLISVDIFRVKDGKLAEHWDVLQQEVPGDKTVSKNPMFPITS